MRIHLIKRQNILDFAKTNSGGKGSFEDWLVKLKYADWKVSMDIKSTYKTADILGRSSNRVIFNIGGNNYRMICKFAFGTRSAFICLLDRNARGL